LRRVQTIIEADPLRRYIVVSAPGKRTPEDRKITDLLYAWHSLEQQGLDASEPRGIIAGRFQELAGELGVAFDADAELEAVAQQGASHPEPDYMASRGEHLMARLTAEFLGGTFVEPVECIHFDEEGYLHDDTYGLLADRLKGDGLFIVPGFYGAMPDGSIKTFSRGGSDITGAIVARASGSSLYENWTDVPGFLMADPRIVPNAKPIQEVTYTELRELSYMGAHVLHDEAIFPVRKVGIPIHIRNTHVPSDPGTRIVPTRTPDQAVCGIAGRRGFTMLNITKTLMNRERGFGRRVLSVLEELGISWEHMPTGIDTISLIIKDEELGKHGPTVVKNIERRCEPDEIRLTHDLAIIATVGQGMAGHVGLAAELFSALARANVNIVVIDQGSSENNIIIGVNSGDLEPAVSAIYEALVEFK
jgi:aspartate kinase